MTGASVVDYMTAAPGRFSDRRQAGRLLAMAVAAVGEKPPILVLGLPRGGVPVAYEVALALQAPLDVVVVRKLGYPGQPELAVGAIASGGAIAVNGELASGLSRRVIERIAEREQRELERREAVYRGGRAGENPAGKVVVLVDDGIATGSTMRAAIAAVRQRRPARIVVAVPVASASKAEEIGRLADRSVCLIRADFLLAVGQWYEDFSATSDEDVRDLLTSAAKRDLADVPLGAPMGTTLLPGSTERHDPGRRTGAPGRVRARALPHVDGSPRLESEPHER